MANSSSPTDCQKCSSNGPQLKFSRLPILDMYSISAQFLQAAKFRKGSKPLSLSLSLSLFFFQGEFDDSFKLEMGKNPLLPERKKNTTITSSTSVSFYVLNL
jgi:hypothetical protein